MEGQFLHSDSALIRRLSCLAYCLATASATLFWAAFAFDAPSAGRWIGAAIGAVPVWWIAAGVALRLVRLVERFQRSVGQQDRSHLVVLTRP